MLMISFSITLLQQMFLILFTVTTDDEINSLPEVDQNAATENGSLRVRTQGKKTI